MAGAAIHLQNAQAVPAASVPVSAMADFRRTVIDAERAGAHLSALFGLASLTVAAVFIIRRMLAYSSVEHMGLVALGIGLGGAASFGVLLQAVNHSLTKGMLFLVAGNILAAYRTKRELGTGGVVHVLPISGVLWLAGFLAISGSPPAGIAAERPRESWLTVLPPMALGLGVLGLGVYLPPALEELLRHAARAVGGAA